MSGKGIALGGEQNLVKESRVVLSLGSQRGERYILKIGILLKQDSIKELLRKFEERISFTLISKSAEIIKGEKHSFLFYF